MTAPLGSSTGPPCMRSRVTRRLSLRSTERGVYALLNVFIQSPRPSLSTKRQFSQRGNVVSPSDRSMSHRCRTLYLSRRIAGLGGPPFRRGRDSSTGDALPGWSHRRSIFKSRSRPPGAGTLRGGFAFFSTGTRDRSEIQKRETGTFRCDTRDRTSPSGVTSSRLFQRSFPW